MGVLALFWLVSVGIGRLSSSFGTGGGYIGWVSFKNSHFPL